MPMGRVSMHWYLESTRYPAKEHPTHNALAFQPYEG
jgi:hypothetical protein